MSGLTFQQEIRIIAKLVVLWILLLVLPFAERTLLGSKTILFPIPRARTGLRAVWVNHPVHFLFLAARPEPARAPT